MPSYEKSRLWQNALAARIEDATAKERERLRVAYELIRSRAKPLAETIAKDLPDFTVHDITHSDALWEYADLIVGANYPINPAEAFVLGCAFLLHDLGMGLAAYPEGLVGVKKSTVWRDSVAQYLRKEAVDQKITEERIESAPEPIQRAATRETLRRLHATRAETLVLNEWSTPDQAQKFYLIDDAELRTSFGPIIGRISHSHWWSLEQLTKDFSAVLGAQVGFPQNWTVDPMKLACILRCSDFAHVDERRAPAFLWALRQPDGASEDHWKFQGKLYQPRLEADRLVFTAKSSFSITDAGAWWTCYDTLHGIDLELRAVDSLLADTRRHRFAATGVSQADEPLRLSKLIKTEGWQPVDTRIRVTAVADLVRKLGGKDLYGQDVSPPLREMIQNAADAVRARRLVDGRSSTWGTITVTLGKDGAHQWIQVEDTGVGMSEAVLTGPLLDFGTSFWGTPMMHDQLPGLASKGFEPQGRYGIGFFSVFMWGERVEVTTRRYDKSHADTLVLCFAKGLNERPLLRRGTPAEHVPDGGTRLRIWLSDDAIIDKLFASEDDNRNLTLSDVCGRIAPCLDVTLKAGGKTVVKANDWITIKDETLLRRIAPIEKLPKRVRDSHFDGISWPKLAILKSDDGTVLGRAAVWKWEGFYSSHSAGSITVGGLHGCSLGGLVGVLIGSPVRAARDVAIPSTPLPVLMTWAESERVARLKERRSPEILNSLAEVFVSLGLHPKALPISKTDSGWVTPEDIEKLATNLNEVILVHDASIQITERRRDKIKLDRGVFAVGMSMMSIVHARSSWVNWPPTDEKNEWGERKFYSRTCEGAVIQCFARGWNCALKDIFEESSFSSDLKSFERVIGSIGNQPVKDHVTIIRRPKHAVSSKKRKLQKSVAS